MTAQIDWEKVDQWLAAGCNGIQCAAAIGIHYETLARRCKSDKNMDFVAYMQEKRSNGDAMIHAAQFHKAIKEKHPTMLVWLGKQRLGQKEDGDKHASNDLGSKFDEFIKGMNHLFSERNIEESSINNETKS